MTTLKEERRSQLIETLPELERFKTVLYIGAKVKKKFPKGMEMIDLFQGWGYSIDILEAWSQNVRALVQMNRHGRRFLNDVEIRPGIFNRIYCERVEAVDQVIRNVKAYDVVFWWHGPEHVDHKDLSDTVIKAEQLAKCLIVMGCPWGVYRQKAVGGNSFEIHQSAIYPKFFTDRGYEIKTLGTADEKKSNVLAWKWMGKEIDG